MLNTIKFLEMILNLVAEIFLITCLTAFSILVVVGITCILIKFFKWLKKEFGTRYERW